MIYLLKPGIILIDLLIFMIAIVRSFKSNSLTKVFQIMLRENIRMKHILRI